MSKNNLYMLIMGIITAASVIALIVVLATGGNQTSADGSSVIATVNGEEITKNEVYDAMFSQPAGGGQSYGDQTLEQLINEVLVDQEARKQNIELTPEEINEKIESEIEKWKRDFGSEEQFDLILAQSGMTLDDLKSDLRDQLPMRMKLEKLFESKIEVTDEEIKTYYEENKDTFTEPEQVHASHILLETEEEANEILAQLNEGADFAELAKEHSKDPGSAQNGGDLGFFGRGEMVPEFEEAAFSLEVGEMSGVVESEHGYHIIKVTDKKEAKEYTLEEKREEIREQLFAQKLNAQVPAWLNELKQNAEIEKM